MRVALNISACDNQLREIVSCFGFPSACEYFISSVPNLSNIVPNLSNIVPNSLGISNKVCC